MKRFLLLLTGALLISSVSAWAQEESPTPDKIVISKQDLTLTLYGNDNSIIVSYPIAVGKNPGNKQVKGDMKTPEGEFYISQIQSATKWTHDFGDGKGEIKGCYGDWFFRLHTPPHRGIGIHGTHAPESIGTRATEGCIRLRNEDLNALHDLVHEGMKVTILAGDLDREADNGEVTITEDTPSESVESDNTTSAPTSTVVDNTPESEQIWHIVEDGDLVGAIAIRYGTSVSKLKELNPELNVDRISIGQRIRVK